MRKTEDTRTQEVTSSSFATLVMGLAVLALTLPVSAHAQPVSESETAAQEQEETEEGKGKKVAEELVDILLGGLKKKGKIASMKVAERRGNSIRINVSYRKVKLPRDVHLTANVVRRGERLSGFESTVADVDDDKGRVPITITWTDAQEGFEQESDQIEIVMFRGDSAARAMKKKRFSLAKIWTAYSTPDAVVVGKPTPPPPPPSGPKPVEYAYTALTYGNVKQSGNVRAGSLTWRCGGSRCTITGPWPTPGVGACQALARQVGQIRYYGHAGRRLSGTQLSQCNKVVAATPRILVPATPLPTSPVIRKAQ